MKKFFSGAAVFAFIGVAAKAIGVLYRLPLTDVLKAEGMGLYQTVFPLYALVLTASSGGLPCAISAFVSKNRLSSDKALRLSIAVVTAVCVVITVIVLLFSRQIADLQGNSDAAVAYKFIAPAVIFSGIIACFRGYFQGQKNMLPSGISQLTEQAIKAAIGISLAKLWIDKGIVYGVCGAIVGVTASEAVALAFMVITYLCSKNRYTVQNFRLAAEAGEDVNVKSNREIIKGIYSTALPVTLNSLALPVTLAADSFIILNVLGKNATAVYGVWSGPVSSLINMPSVISVAIAAAVLPDAARDEKDFRLDKILAALLPIAVIFFCSSKVILRVLYPSLSSDEWEIGASLLSLCSVNVLSVGVISVTSAFLQANGRAKTPLINLAIGCAVKIVLSLVLLKNVGIVGAAIGSIACYLIAAVGDFVAAVKYGGKASAKTLRVAICSAIFCGVYVLFAGRQSLKSALVGGIVAVTAYIFLLIKTKCIKIK